MRDSGAPRGRGSGFNTPNRFERTHLEPLDIDIQYDDEAPPLKTTFYTDSSKSILAKNDSPDLPFTYSINPYRGCEHGCIYCYARPSHEYLGFSAGLDFETKIMVKLEAAELLEETLQKASWQPQMVAFSGNTDCYQPVERKLQLTRKCLEVFLKFRNPVGLITKNALVLRDLDIFQEWQSTRSFTS
jgi:DNA repair photolyase